MLLFFWRDIVKVLGIFFKDVITLFIKIMQINLCSTLNTVSSGPWEQIKEKSLTHLDKQNIAFKINTIINISLDVKHIFSDVCLYILILKCWGDETNPVIKNAYWSHVFVNYPIFIYLYLSWLQILVSNFKVSLKIYRSITSSYKKHVWYLPLLWALLL